MDVRNRKWTEDELFRMRKEVLATWPTGAEVDINEAIEYHRRLPRENVMVELNRRTKREGRPYVEKPIGRATVEDQVGHMQAVAEAGADVVDLFADTYTRKSQYEKAQAGLEESRRRGISMLNGFPIVCHGVKNIRRIVEAVRMPVMRGTTDEDPRLQAEIVLAGGFTALGFCNIHDLLQHSKSYPLDRRIINDQYVTRLAAYYVEHGAPIDMFTPGNLNGWDPPEMKIALVITQSLMAAEQGIKDITVIPFSTVHLVQNVAMLRVTRQLMREYLDRSGYRDTNVTVKYGTWQGDWPLDLNYATALYSWDVATGILGGADGLWVRGVDESHGLSKREADVACVKIARKLAQTIGRLRLPDGDDLRLEEEMMRLAVRAIVDRTIDLGDGDVAVGEIEAVKKGVIDASFSPWTLLARKVLPARDITGAIRFLDYGNIPLPREVAEYHRLKIAERSAADGMKADIQMVIHDVTCLSRPLMQETASVK